MSASQAGNPYLPVDVPWGAVGYAERPVTLPANGALLCLRTWGHLDPSRAIISIIVNVWGGHTRQYVLENFTVPSLESGGGSGCSGQVPVTREYNLMPFAGQTVKVQLEATATGYNGTITDFDDVTVTELPRVYWTGGAGNWSDTNNWSPFPPSWNTALVLPAGANVTVDTPDAEIGALLVEAGATLGVLAGASLSLNGPVWNHGTMNFSGEVISYAAGNAFVQNDTLYIKSGVALKGMDSGGQDFAFLHTGGTTTIGGTLDWSNGIIQMQNGTLEVQSEAALRGMDSGGSDLAFVQSGGEVILNGTFETSNAGLQGGTMSGGGTLAGNLINDGGTLAPGASPGMFTITGNYVQTNTDMLRIEGADRAAGRCDQLRVGGTAHLGGMPEVALLNSFAPDIGEQFLFLVATNRSGTFSQLSAPAGLALTHSSTGLVPVLTGRGPTDILGPVPTGGNRVFRFGTVSNRSYTVQFNDDLTTTNWVFYTDIMG